jgi:hypothetical protein
MGTATLIVALALLTSCAENDGDSIDCTDTAVLSMEAVTDEHMWVADYPLAGCPELATSFLFRNTGLAPITIEEARVDDNRFSVSADLPRQLAPGQTLAVILGFRSKAQQPSVEAMARLTLAGPDGCVAVDVRGLTVEEGGLVSQSAAAVDFGDVPIGETRTHELTISWQRRPTDPAPRVIGFGAGPDGFALVSAPTVEFEPAPCDSRTIRLSFTAPASGGLHEGALFWEQESQGFFGLSAVPLFGNATALPP